MSAATPTPSSSPATSPSPTPPPPPPISPSPAVIPYAELPTRWGIVVDRREDELTITIPQTYRWRSFNGLAPIVTAAAMLALGGFIFMFERRFLPAVPQLLLIGVITGTVGLAYLWLTRKPVIIALTRSHLLLRNAPIIGPDGKKDWPRTARYPRAGVYEVKYVSHSGNLVIRVQGEEIIETRPVPDPRVLEWLAGQLRDVLAITP